MRSSDGVRRGLRRAAAGAAAAVVLAMIVPGVAVAAPLTAAVVHQTRHFAGGDTVVSYRNTSATPVGHGPNGSLTTTVNSQQVWVLPPAGGRFTVGDDPQAWGSADPNLPFPDHAGIYFEYSNLCLQFPTAADVAVDQVSYAPDGTLTSFAGHIAYTCTSTGDSYEVELRLADDEPITGFGLLGDVTLPPTTLTRTLHPGLQNTGTSDIALGAISLSGVPAGWSATVDPGTCGATLAAAHGCAPTVVVTGDGNPGGFALHVQTPGGPTSESLFWVHAIDPIPTPVLATRPAVDGVHLSWTSPVASYDAQAWDVYRSDSADGPWTLLRTTSGRSTYDVTVDPGATAYYKVTARRTFAGLAAPSTSAVVAGRRLATAPTVDTTDAAFVSTGTTTWTGSTSTFVRDLDAAPDGAGTYPSSALAAGFFSEQRDPYGGVCLRPVGTYTVRDLVRRADGSFARLDASVSGTCYGGAPWRVELRRSEAGQAFGDVAAPVVPQADPMHAWLGDKADVVFALANDGNAPATLGTPTLSAGGHEAEWSLASTCTSPLAPGVACQVTATWTSTAAGSETVTLHVPGAGLTGSLDLTHHVVAEVDADPPYLTGTPVQPLLVDDMPHMQTASYFDTQSGVTSMDVRFRSAGATSTSLGSWMYPAVWQGTAWDGGPVQVSTPRPGKTSCISVRARDARGNISGWSPASCASQVFDDADVTADRHWTPGFGSWTRFDHGTYSVTTTKGATFTGHIVRARHVGVLVTTCATCGSLDVYIGSTLVGRVSTYSPRVHYRVMVILRVHSTSAYGRLRLVVHSSGSRVIVDGFGATIA